MAELGLRVVPVLARLVAGPAGRPRPGQPGRARLLPPAGRRAARRTASSRGSRSTTGTCRRRWRTPAAGRRATPPHRFAEYAAARARRARRPGPLLDHPQRAVVLGVPRLRLGRARARAASDGGDAVRAAHHLMLGHGLAVQAMRAAGPDTQVGITLNLYAISPQTGVGRPTPDAARRIDGLANRIFLDPVLRGRYPADVVADLRDGDRLRARPRRRPGHHRHAAGRARASTTTAGTSWPRRCRGSEPRAVLAPAVELAGQRGRPVRHPRRPGHRHGLGDRRAGPGRGPAPGARRVPGRSRCTSPRTGRPSSTRSSDGQVDDPRPAGVLRCPPAGLSRGDRGRGAAAGLLRLVAAWTTSNGRGATRSASAWCTWTTRASAGSPKSSAQWYADGHPAQRCWPHNRRG